MCSVGLYLYWKPYTQLTVYSLEIMREIAQSLTLLMIDTCYADLSEKNCIESPLTINIKRTILETQ